MTFAHNPLIIGEVHNDLVTMKWLIDNLEDLYKQGYTGFAYEYDHDIKLDDLIAQVTKQIENIKTQYQNPKVVEETLEEMKRNTLINLLSPREQNKALLPTEELLKYIDQKKPSFKIRQQIAKHESHTREVFAASAAALPEKELTLQLLLKVKDLGMAYVGLDDKLGGKRSNLNDIFQKRDAEVEKRNLTIAKRIAISAKLHKGGLICLLGARHLIGICEELPKQFDLPFLKADKDSITQFKFVRIMNPDYQYNEIIEQHLESEFSKLNKEHSWFDVLKVNFNAAKDFIFDLLQIDKVSSDNNSSVTEQAI